MTTIKYIIMALISASLLASSGCSEDSVDPKTKALNDQLHLLMNQGKAWVVGGTGSVEKDGYDVSNQFAAFRLTIGNKTYVTENALNNVWKTNGSWDFHEANPQQFIREDDVLVTVAISDNKLILTFSGAGTTSGRTNSIPGEYSFELVSE
ncbi:MAG TPA: hypothetical protein VD927_18790 [Chryseosolibacter sp.]|nr:hypothetical protein [Chryseosolibacter sp.]